MLALRIEMPKNEFSLDEEWPVLVSLNNQSTTPLVVNARLALNSRHAATPFWEVAFVLHNGEQEEPFGARVNIGEPASKDFKLLQPRETIERTYNLQAYYQLRAGRYSIQAIYRNEQRIDQDTAVWIGEVGSPSLKFQIV